MMAKPSASQLLPIYRRNLERYETEGRDDDAAVQRRLIARLEREAEPE